MAIFEITGTDIREAKATTFSNAKVKERSDLQRLLRAHVSVISPETMVLAEEFCEWEDSRRRIDLLGVDKHANLVVIELKRTDDGGHMELQAVRYAAMVSAMTFEKIVEVYGGYLKRNNLPGDAREKLLEFLDWDVADEDRFAQDVRLVLVSAEFSKELTTAVMWLNERDLDIRCVRMKPYDLDGKLLVDVQQLIPLPEAEDYIVKIREKEGQERSARKVHSESEKLLYRYWTQLLTKARLKTNLHANISPSRGWWISAGAGKSGLGLNYVFGKKCPRVELYIDTGEKSVNKRVFDQLNSAKTQIEQCFGGTLGWERLDDKRACRIRAEFEGGTVFDERNWEDLQQSMIDTMIRFEAAIRPELNKLP